MARGRKKRKARSSSKAVAPTETSSTPCLQSPAYMQERRKGTVIGAQGITDERSTELNGQHAAGHRNTPGAQRQKSKQRWARKVKRTSETPQYTLLRRSDSIGQDNSTIAGRPVTEQRSAVETTTAEGVGEDVQGSSSASSVDGVGDSGIEDRITNETDGNDEKGGCQSPGKNTAGQDQSTISNASELGMMYSQTGSRDPTRQLSSIIRAFVTPHEERCSFVEDIDVLLEVDVDRAAVNRRNRRAQPRQQQGGSCPSQWSYDYRPRGKRQRELFYRWVPEGFRKSSRLSKYQEQCQALSKLHEHYQTPPQYPGALSSPATYQCWPEHSHHSAQPPVDMQNPWLMPVPNDYDTYVRIPQHQLDSVATSSPMPWTSQARPSEGNDEQDSYLYS